MSARLDHVIDAATAYAAAYDGDDRPFIKTDVLNAFYAGQHWQAARVRRSPTLMTLTNHRKDPLK